MMLRLKHISVCTSTNWYSLRLLRIDPNKSKKCITAKDMQVTKEKHIDETK